MSAIGMGLTSAGQPVALLVDGSNDLSTGATSVSGSQPSAGGSHAIAYGLTSAGQPVAIQVDSNGVVQEA